MRFDLSVRHSEVAHRWLALGKVPWLEWWLARQTSGSAPRLRIPIGPKKPGDASSSTTMTVSKWGGRIVRLHADLEWLQSRSGFSTLHRRMGIFIRLLSDTDVPDGDWRVDPTDAVPDEGPTLGFCTRWRDSILVPDRGFVTKRGYERERRAGRAAPAFDDRDPEIVWRGSPTGTGATFADPMDPSSPFLAQRVRLCLLLRHRPQSGADAVDVRFSRGRSVGPHLEDRYRAAGILAEYQPPQSWCRRRFAIDIDGQSNAFSNLFIRLLYGCCVIRVASPHGYRQWYHDRLEPGRHYVPAASDLSDIEDVIDWCRRHPAVCRTIARDGQRLAMAMTFAREMRSTVGRLGSGGARAAPTRAAA